MNRKTLGKNDGARTICLHSMMQSMKNQRSGITEDKLGLEAGGVRSLWPGPTNGTVALVSM